MALVSALILSWIFVFDCCKYALKIIMIIIQAAPPNGNIRVEFKKASAVAAEEVNKANIVIIIIIIIIIVIIIIIIVTC